MSSERLRQREVHKYYQSWLESSVGFHDRPTTDKTRFHSDGTKFSLSRDTALTSFAQLGCLKLNVKRAVVTLISTSRQYILAEATTSTLLSDQGDDNDANDDIWFGNASIPRSQGISGAALTPADYTALAPGGTSFTAPALIIDDLTKHPDFSTRPYAGNGISFYCGIPIVTKDGSAIGVYSLSDDQPRQGLQPIELRYVCDLASVIMRHLETVKNEAARFRGETMVLGLGQFIQGSSTVSAHNTPYARLPLPKTGIEPEAQIQPRMFKGMTITAADPSALHAVSRSQLRTHYEVATPTQNIIDTRDAAQATQHDSGLSGSPSTNTPQPDIDLAKSRSTRPSGHNIFARAANILRECCGADGVLFFDAVSTNLAKRSSTTGFKSANKKSKSKNGGNRTSRSREASAGSRSPTTIDSDEIDSSEERDNNEESSKTCTLLGFSVDVTEQTPQRAQELKSLAMTEAILRRLIRRYPQGKVFYFDPTGNLSSSENEVTVSSSTTSETNAVILKEDPFTRKAEHRTKGFKSKFADELKRLVPQAQSIIWLPMWDFSKQRWSAGAFLWTKMAEQLIVAQDDLVYLKTFANSIMIEVARQDAASADDMKTTFIANISHELRSPLHGVVGSCELLKDTHLDEHQASLVKAIELCGRTLNDTVDHVLDYTKINQLIKRGGHLPRSDKTKEGRHDIPAVDRSMLEDDFDLAILVQDSVEAVCASRSSQHQRLRGQSSAILAEVDTTSGTRDAKSVQVILKLAHQDNWWVRSQPGAIKRILTNLVQNSIKYTDSGTVTVALSLRNTSPRRHRRGSDGNEAENETNVTIAVTDTGRGMSNDFIRNHAFTPFSQESSFSDGTGLGLSIVQLIVDSLGGKIELKSRREIGTEIKVHLTLPRSRSSEPPSVNDPQFVKAKVAGKSLCLVRSIAEESTSRRRPFEAAIGNTALTWLGIEIKRSTSLADVQADFYLYTSLPKAADIVSQIDRDSLPGNSSIILFVSNAAEKLKLKKDLEELKRQGLVIEIVLHPVGPQKLCEALNRCLSRQENASTVVPRAEAVQLQNIEVEGGEEASSQIEVPVAQQTSEKGEPTGTTDLTVQQNKTTSSPDWLGGKRSPRKSITIPTTSHSSQRSHDLGSLALNTKDSKQGLSTSVPPSSTTKHILLVDDNAINLNILKAAMKKGKFEFETANDGLEALEAFKQANRVDSGVDKPFTHILMDINMPVMDGIESTRFIRQFEKEQAGKHTRSRAVRRGASLSDCSKSTTEIRQVKSPTPNDDDDGTPSDFLESLPMSPLDPKEFNFAVSQIQRTRPLLSPIQLAGEPARAVTYSQDDGGAESKPILLNSMPKGPPSRVMIIALSGVAFEQTQKDMFAVGADMFFAKPIKLKELIKLLNEESNPQEI